MKKSEKDSKVSSIFITGITSGIGNEVLQLCLQKDWHVTGLIRSPSQRKIFKNLSHKNLSLHVADLSLKDQMAPVAEELRKTPFDYILLNAACAKVGYFHHLSTDSIDEIMETNVLSYMRLVHSLLPQALKSRTKFVIVSSLVARLPAPNYATYATSKAALSKFVNSLQKEYPSLSFLLVEIGAVDTPLHEKANNVVTNKKRFKSPELIAHRLFKAMLTKTGTVTLSWEWSLVRRFAMIAGL